MAIQGTTQFPVSHDTQTSPSMYALYKDTYIPVHNNLPVMDITTSDIPLHQVNFAPNPATTPITVPRGDDQSPHDSQIYSQDIVFRTLLQLFVVILKCTKILGLGPSISQRNL